MRYLSRVLLVALLLPSPLLARAKLQGYVQQGNTTLAISGGIGKIGRKVQGSFPGATVTLYVSGSTTPMAAGCYADNAGTPKACSFASSADGSWYVYLDSGRYDVRFSGGDIAVPFTIGDLIVFDPDNMSIQSFSVTKIAKAGACTAALGGAGAVTAGPHAYVITFVTAMGETENSLWSPSGLNVSNTVTAAPGGSIVNLTGIPTGAASVTARKIYRTRADPADNYYYYLVATLPGNLTTVYTDNTADAAIGPQISPSDNTTGGLFYDNSGALIDAPGETNTAFGRLALNDNVTATSGGYQNSAFGWNALKSNTTGLQNVAVGGLTLEANTVGNYNTAVGAQTQRLQTTAIENTSLGANTLYYNVAGSNNVAVGIGALYKNQASLNTAVGSAALQQSTTGANNTALGQQALQYNTTGSDNVGVGLNALISNTTGSFNNAFGQSALPSSVTASNNNAFGTRALYGTTTGTGNIGIGQDAGRGNVTGSNNIFIGNGAGYAGQANNLTNTIVLGAGAYSSISDTFIVGAVGAPMKFSINSGPNPTHVLDVNGTIRTWGTYAALLLSSDTGVGADWTIYDSGGYLNFYGGGVAPKVMFDPTLTGRVTIGGADIPTSTLQVIGLPAFANNAAAVAGGLTAGAFYRTGGDPDLVCVVH